MKPQFEDTERYEYDFAKDGWVDLRDNTWITCGRRFWLGGCECYGCTHAGEKRIK